MTHRLYYTEPSCRRFDAVVTRALDHEGRPAVTLSRTAFYPSSGGQPFDTGRLNGVNVVDTVDAGDDIIHVLSVPLAQDTAVIGDIDWERRFDHMQQHTGQHILSGAFETFFDNMTVGFSMGASASTIDLAREVSAVEIERGVDESNRIVWEDRAVTIRFVSQMEAETLSLRKQPTRDGILRLIEIDRFDLCACGGTHVDRTGAIGLIAVTGVEKMRGGSRLTFVCGGRALRALRSYRDTVTAGVRVLSVVPTELPAAIERLHAESKDLHKRLRSLQEKLAEHEGARLAREAHDVGGVRLVAEVLDGTDVADLKALAAAVTGAARACVVLVTSDQPVSVVVACSPTVPVDANTVLQQLTRCFGGRGGGKPRLAQGGGLTAPAQEVASAAEALVRSILSP